jgi:hypothetical protein
MSYDYFLAPALDLQNGSRKQRIWPPGTGPWGGLADENDE